MLPYERFLLYRGSADVSGFVKLRVFAFPSKGAEGRGRWEVRNSGDQEIRDILFAEVSGKTGTFSSMGPLTGGASASVPRGEVVSAVELEREGKKRMIDLLVAAGLYAKEAVAMMGYWAAEWFTREGARAIYLLPAGEIDRLLPLEITPRPDETVRVMAACVEVITPERSAAISALVSELGSNDFARREAAQAELARLGCLAESALRGALASEDLEVCARAKTLLALLDR